MFRKRRESAPVSSSASTVKNESKEAPRRFFQIKSFMKSLSTEEVAFSVGVENPSKPQTAKPKTPGLFSRLFKRSTESIKSLLSEDKKGSEAGAAVPTGTKRKSLWQRSKSILRPRTVLDRSESTVLDLPFTLNLRGSGSAAELLLNEYPTEEYCFGSSGVDTDGLLQRIFEMNHVLYEKLKEKEYLTAAAVEGDVFIPAAVSTPVVLESVEDFLSCSRIEDRVENDEISDHPNQPGEGAPFSDNPKFDSPLLPASSTLTLRSIDEESGSSGSSLSLESSIRSFASCDYDLKGVENMSLEEIAEMFDLLSVTEKPQTLSDGSVRVVVENERGSAESIRFHNWKEPIRACKSDDRIESIKLTDINVNSVPKPLSVKMRSLSLANLPTAAKKEADSPTAFDRRRSLGAKVSQIVAMFEGAAVNN